jgi:bis(5'-nucleosidyl)-tetraphosphatase
MSDIKSCGFIVMRKEPQLGFLLMQKSNRYDLPKGHIEPGETELECAIRELYEETGIEAKILQLDQIFRFTTTYQTRYQQQKTLVIFLGWLQQEVVIQLSEHSGYTWLEWSPPHTIQEKVINPLLAQLEDHLLNKVFPT